MIGALKNSGVKSDTLSFREYRKFAVATLIDEHGTSKQKARTLSALLEVLESYRVSFSKGDYRFKTKRVSNMVLANDLGVTDRYVQMLLRILEKTGIIAIHRRRVGQEMNLWNAFEFTGFMEWLARYAQSRCTPVHPKEESNLRLPFRTLAFPKSDLSSFKPRHEFWRVVAKEALPAGAQLPCLARLSAKFRLNLRKHSVDHDDPSIIGRWKAFVKRSVEFSNQPRRLG